jgi:type II secretory pathway pseudopilin PulG
LKSSSLPGKRRCRAVTLIEAVLYIAVALALIVGGLVFFQQASTAQKTSATIRQLSALLAETRVMVKGYPLAQVTNPDLLSSTTLDITAFLIAAGAAPTDMIASATTLSNPFGGTTSVNAAVLPWGPTMLVTLTNVPRSACTRLLTGTSGVSGSLEGGSTVVSTGFLNGGAVAPNAGFAVRSFIMNPTEAGWMCEFGGLNYVSQTTRPTTPPLPNNVTVFMSFLVER